MALGAVAAAAAAWTGGPAAAVTFNVVDIVDPLNPTFTQALGINNASTIVGYGNATIFNGFQLVLPRSTPPSPRRSASTATARLSGSKSVAPGFNTAISTSTASSRYSIRLAP